MEPADILSHRPHGLIVDDIRQRLAARKPVEIAMGDHALNPDMDFAISPSLRPAAVLVLLVPFDDHLSIVFTERTAHLKSHAGQVSFPGGRVDDIDDDEVATALREAREEIGLDPSTVEIIGRLDHYRTGTNFLVKPVVGYVTELPVWTPNAFEVADIFTVPLPVMMEPDAMTLHRVMVEGVERSYYALRHNRHYIWGATAGILKGFVDIVTGGNK